MCQLPRTIENPVTGDEVTFIASPLLGDGHDLVFECRLPGASGAERDLRLTWQA